MRKLAVALLCALPPSVWASMASHNYDAGSESGPVGIRHFAVLAGIGLIAYGLKQKGSDEDRISSGGASKLPIIIGVLAIIAGLLTK